jgi:hypothetical protein
MLLSLVPLFAYDMYDEKLKIYVINIYIIMSQVSGSSVFLSLFASYI